MATVIERERPSSVLIERSDGAGWAVAAVIIIAILAVGAFVWARYYSVPAPQQNPGTNINVTVPGTTQDSGETGGNTNQTPSGSGGTQPIGY